MGSNGSRRGRPPGGDLAGDWPGGRGVRVAGVEGGGIAAGVPPKDPGGSGGRSGRLWGDRGDVAGRERAVGLLKVALVSGAGPRDGTELGVATDRCISLASLSSVM